MVDAFDGKKEKREEERGCGDLVRGGGGREGGRVEEVHAFE